MSTVTSSIGSCFSPSDVLVEHHARLAHGQLVAFAAHVLQQDGQVQFAAAADLEDAVLVGVLDTRSATLLCSSFCSRSQIWRLVTNLPSRPASGLVLTQKFIVSVGSSTFSIGSGAGWRVGHGHADADVLDAVDQHDVARAGARPWHACAPGPSKVSTWLMRPLRGADSGPSHTSHVHGGLSVPWLMRPTPMRPTKVE
jgi:hypothetical protein